MTPPSPHPNQIAESSGLENLIRVALEVADGCASFAERLRAYGYPGGAGGHDLMAQKLREAASKARDKGDRS